MLHFLDLPHEIHIEITNHLVALDVTVLAATCRTLRQQLGQGNQHFWFSRLRSGIPNHDSNSSPDTCIFSGDALQMEEFERLEKELEEIRAEFQAFDPDRDYWQVVMDIIMSKAKRGCGCCLKVTETLSLYIEFHVGRRIDQKYCESCFRDRHWKISMLLEKYPELHIPSSISRIHILDRLYPKNWGSDYVDNRYYRRYRPGYITKAEAKRLVDEQAGPLPEPRSQSDIFLANWTMKTRRLGQANDRAISFIIDKYTNCFKRFHIAIEPQTLHHLLCNCVIADFPKQSTRNSDSLLPLDTYEMVRSIGEYLDESLERPPTAEVRKSLAVKRATEFLVRLFGVQDNEPFKAFDITKIYDHNFLKVHLKDWIFGVLDWMKIFSQALDIQTDDVRKVEAIYCYWCLTTDPSNVQGYSKSEYSETGISHKWIAVHLIEKHQDLLRKRPSDPIGRNWRHRTRLIGRDIPQDPSLWNYELEDVPPKKCADMLDL